MEEVAPGKKNLKNAIKSCQIVLFSSKTAAKRPSSSTVGCRFTKHSETQQWKKMQIFGTLCFLTTSKGSIKFFIFEGRTNIQALSEKLPKWHFLTHEHNSKNSSQSALKVSPSDFIQNMTQAQSKCLKQRIKVDKLDYFKNPS